MKQFYYDAVMVADPYGDIYYIAVEHSYDDENYFYVLGAVRCKNKSDAVEIIISFLED